MQPKAKTRLTFLLLADGTPAAQSVATDATAEGAGNNSGSATAPQPPAVNGGQGAPAPKSGEQPGNQPNDQKPEDAKVSLSQAELDAIKQQAVSAALADHKKREADKLKKATNQKTREQAETDGDAVTLLEVEKTEHNETRAEVTRLEGEVAKLTRSLAVNKVAGRYKLEPELVELLENNAAVTDEASAEIFAKKLTKFQKTETAPPNDAGSGNRPTAKKPDAGGKPSSGNNGSGNDNGAAPKRYGWQREDEVAYPD